MINILYIGVGPYNGGPVISLLQLVQNLDKTKFKPFIFSLPHTGADILKELSQIKKVTILESDLWINNWLQASNNNIKSSLWNKIKFPGRVLRSFYNSWHISKLIKKNRIDIVHTNIELVIEGALAALIADRPHVWHIRAPIGKNGAVKHFMGQKFCCFLMSRLSAKIIVNSKATLSSIKNYVNNDKINLIYNGIDPEKFISKVKNGGIKQLLNIERGKKIVASIGYLSQIKGADSFVKIAIDICTRFDNVVFVWIGPSKERVNDAFSKSIFLNISENQLEEKILFTDERNDIEKLLIDVDIFLQPMKNGSWSRVVLEAMAASLPVVAIEESIRSEVIENNVNGILVCNEVEAINLIERLLFDEYNCRLLGKNARKHVVNNFSNLKTTSEIMSIYEAII